MVGHNHMFPAFYIRKRLGYLQMAFLHGPSGPIPHRDTLYKVLGRQLHRATTTSTTSVVSRANGGTPPRLTDDK